MRGLLRSGSAVAAHRPSVPVACGGLSCLTRDSACVAPTARTTRKIPMAFLFTAGIYKCIIPQTHFPDVAALEDYGL